MLRDAFLRAAKFQSTRPLRGATEELIGGFDAIAISIHAPLAGRDKEDMQRLLEDAEFQSTRPLRGATPATPTTASPLVFQSTRPLRGATTMDA